LEVYDFEEFFRRTKGGRPNQMNTAPYEGAPFGCACGESHVFSENLVPVLRELGGMRLVLGCPRGGYVTCVKVRGLVQFRGFRSLFGGVSADSNDNSDSDEGDIDEDAGGAGQGLPHPPDDHKHFDEISRLVGRAFQLDPEMNRIATILDQNQVASRRIVAEFPKDAEGDFVNESFRLALRGLAGRIGTLGAVCFRAEGDGWNPCGLTGDFELAHGWLSGELGDAVLNGISAEYEISSDDVDLVYWRFVVGTLESRSE